MNIPPGKSIFDLILWTEERIRECGVEEPRREALFMLSHLVGVKPTELLRRFSHRLNGSKVELLNEWIERRARREPLQYILGETEFWGLNFIVDSSVLIPRPETEHLVEEAVRLLRGMSPEEELRVCDLCTGCGCIAISIAKEVPSARIIATDISAQALGVAHRNAELNRVEDKIRFLEGDLFTPLRDYREAFHIITANPPYVRKAELEELQPEIRLYEPFLALDGGEEGLSFIRTIVREAPSYIKAGGYLVLEIGYGQKDAVLEMMEESGEFTEVRVRKDYGGTDRVVTGRRR